MPEAFRQAQYQHGLAECDMRAARHCIETDGRRAADQFKIISNAVAEAERCMDNPDALHAQLNKIRLAAIAGTRSQSQATEGAVTLFDSALVRLEGAHMHSREVGALLLPGDTGVPQRNMWD